MRGKLCVPMITLCLLLTGCGSAGGEETSEARQPYQDMSGCTMQADVCCGAGSEDLQTFTMTCEYVPDGQCTVEILQPEIVAGVQALVDGESLSLSYADECLNAGTLSSEAVSPAVCLPRIMDALRNGWLLEQNAEDWGEISCERLSLDQTGENGGKVISTVWLNREDHTPVHAEISVDDQIILSAEFTAFQFGDILKNEGNK